MAALPFPLPTNPLPSLYTSRKLHNSSTYFASLNQIAGNVQISYKSYLNQISSLCKQGHLPEALDLVTDLELADITIGPDVYGELLQGCVYERALSLGQQIHGRILKNGEYIAKNEYIETKLVIFYSKCDESETANRLFDKLQVQNEFSWAAIMGLKSRMRFNEEALMGFREMHEYGLILDNFVIPIALKASGALRWIGFGKSVHGYVVKMGLGVCIYVASSLLDMYGKCGLCGDAKKVFDKIPEKNIVAWNSMIVSFTQNGRNAEAIETFYEMRVEGVAPTQVTLSSFLSASANLGVIVEGKQGHALAVLSGLELTNILGSSLINFYSKVGLVENAELVFSEMLEKDTVTWNLLVSGYVHNGLVDRALGLCHVMQSENLRFDSVTLASIMAAAADSRNLKLGKEGHSFCVRNNLESDVAVASSIIDMYAKCENLECARRVFNAMIKRDLIMWNTLLAAYAEQGHSGETLKLFYQMQLEGLPPNVISWNSVILGLLNKGEVDKAKDMFMEMQSLGICPNLITWTTLICGLAQNGLGDEAFLTFQSMEEAGIKPNSLSISSLLSACSTMASLPHGRAIHCYITRRELSVSTPVLCSLVNMYAKCGSINQAKRVFDMILKKELPVYNAMISGYALHGQAAEALSLFRRLKEECIKPDEITFTSILSACSHAGLVREGLELFIDMVSFHKIVAQAEHYGCLVSILSRSHNLDEALRLILGMPFEPDAFIFGSLLTACREHPDFELKEHLFERLLKLEPDNSGNYVALSNAYAATGMWDEALKVRGLMKERSLRKIPGHSLIQIGNKTHVFFAGDKSNSRTKEIYMTLALLRMEMQSTRCISVIS
ncbi:hypothetical protein IC582_004044 [Cucumis melo]|uniref:Pentatricopeptide repeat-containing protein n=1 Tax=Cucumis melo var. makuwa TaxID=1194695 RepID=A0A5A7TJA9_CUCMM|nr:pentatricopeptide repeat-containing protein [Cucumis melo var. makuwa]